MFFDSILHFRFLLSLSASCPLPHAEPSFPLPPSSLASNPHVLIHLSPPRQWRCIALWVALPDISSSPCTAMPCIENAITVSVSNHIFSSILLFFWFFFAVAEGSFLLCFFIAIVLLFVFRVFQNVFPFRFYFSFCFLNLLAKRGQRRGAPLVLS